MSTAGKFFGMVCGALGIVMDVVAVVMDGINAAAAFAKGGTWGDLDGAMDVIQGVAALAVIGSAILLGLTNPVTAVLSVIMLGVCLIAFLINLFKPKPLTGPQLVAVALTHMNLCSYSPPHGCFPASSLVRTGASWQLISSLNLGDNVSTIRADGRVEEQPIHFFGHKDAVSLSVFFHVATESGHNISLTADHLLPIAIDYSTPWHARSFKRTRTVNVGDFLWVSDYNGSPTLRLSKVTSIKTVVGQGMYNPYSLNGATLVDGVAASDHSHWVFDFLVSDSNANILPMLYSPLLQNGLSTLYRVAPTLVESINECYYVTVAAGTSVEDGLCTIRKVAVWAKNTGQQFFSHAFSYTASHMGL
jgi:hypothetical protein